MSKACYQNSIVDDEGNILDGAMVEVRNSSGGGLAALYSDRAGASGISNPVAVDPEGFLEFFVDEGTYDLTVTHADFGTRTYVYNVLLSSHLSADGVGIVSHTPAAGNNNNYTAGGGLDPTTGVLNLSPSAGAATITGLDVTLLRNGQTIMVRNAHASNNVVVSVDDVLSSAANRVSGPFSLTLLPKGTATLKYFSSIGICLQS